MAGGCPAAVPLRPRRPGSGVAAGLDAAAMGRGAPLGPRLLLLLPLLRAALLLALCPPAAAGTWM